MKVFTRGFCKFRTTKERYLCGKKTQEKTDDKYQPVQTKQTSIMRNLSYGFLFTLFLVYDSVVFFRCCCLS